MTFLQELGSVAKERGIYLEGSRGVLGPEGATAAPALPGVLSYFSDSLTCFQEELFSFLNNQPLLPETPSSSSSPLPQLPSLSADAPPSRRPPFFLSQRVLIHQNDPLSSGFGPHGHCLQREACANCTKMQIARSRVIVCLSPCLLGVLAPPSFCLLRFLT